MQDDELYSGTDELAQNDLEQNEPTSTMDTPTNEDVAPDTFGEQIDPASETGDTTDTTMGTQIDPAEEKLYEE